jgi:hypothetical protein
LIRNPEGLVAKQTKIVPADDDVKAALAEVADGTLKEAAKGTEPRNAYGRCQYVFHHRFKQRLNFIAKHLRR